MTSSHFRALVRFTVVHDNAEEVVKILVELKDYGHDEKREKQTMNGNPIVFVNSEWADDGLLRGVSERIRTIQKTSIYFLLLFLSAFVRFFFVVPRMVPSMTFCRSLYVLLLSTEYMRDFIALQIKEYQNSNWIMVEI